MPKKGFYESMWENPGKAKLLINIEEPCLLLYPKAVQQLLGIGATKFYKMVKEPNFPKPRILEGGRAVYIRAEIEEWVKSRPIDMKMFKECINE